MRNWSLSGAEMLSSTADYASAPILLLARHRDDGRSLRADEIARATGAPRNYIAKTLNALAKAGLVTSSVGPSAASASAVPSDAIPLARVIDCFDEPAPSPAASSARVPATPRIPAPRTSVGRRSRRAPSPVRPTTVADLLAG